MASNTRKMLTERTAVLSSQWKELEPEFFRAKASLLAAKDRDNLYTSLVTEGSLDKAFDQAEEYSRTMAKAKKRFESVRMVIETISPEDENHSVIKDIMAMWTPYFETYKKLNRNYCNAHSFRKKRLKEAEDNQKAAEAEACLKEKLALEELRFNNNIAFKRLNLEQSLSGAAFSGASTPISRESPVPPVVTKNVQAGHLPVQAYKLSLL